MGRKLVLVVTFVLSAVACGGSKEPEPVATPAPANLPGTVSFHGMVTLAGDKPSATIQARDDFFEPTFLQVTPGATVTVEVRSTGEHMHTFTIAALKIDQLIAPGETKRVSFKVADSPGARFVCRFHEGTGMQGAFYFTTGADFTRPGAPVTTTEPADPY